jgi:hypothetical protein
MEPGHKSDFIELIAWRISQASDTRSIFPSMRGQDRTYRTTCTLDRAQAPSSKTTLSWLSRLQLRAGILSSDLASASELHGQLPHTASPFSTEAY